MTRALLEGTGLRFGLTGFAIELFLDHLFFARAVHARHCRDRDRSTTCWRKQVAERISHPKMMPNLKLIFESEVSLQASDKCYASSSNPMLSG